ncbi:S-formylglutathione hydrolase FrmB [Kitasatospora gansuensis]|uniref:S-formylglutathione hydrolase FrmB n=1 Tax=Kitasatospora gansuensis TaxID=258050 RepID=A0A7W7S925_9ACTN|nr:alpha/beta hydrolase-fold protein [Kitasatospora gansuensis]MBB4945902.1 S-formylglutathione hydrolase FrmB [Kitasatospora gansuensis]
MTSLRITALGAALALAALTGTGPAHAEAPTAATAPTATAVPAFSDGQGLTLVPGATEVHSPTDFTLTVTTGQLSGKHRIRILLPAGYDADPGRRWPVTYFLHGGGGGVDDVAAAPALHADSMITVVPDGGLKGWYADWRMQNTAEGAANWETFHLTQVVPFIDANLRTLPDRAHRAVVGLSMGGYGSLHYAQARPDLFGQVAALSGGIDFGMWTIRATVLATELNLTGAWCAASSSSSSSGSGDCTGYGPYVDSDAIFGSPYPVFNADRVWKAVDPATPVNLAKLSGTGITLYTGNNDVIDANTEAASKTVKARLDQLGIPSRFVDYGNGSALAPSCNGGHNYGCWAPAFADYVPRLAAAFAAAG